MSVVQKVTREPVLIIGVLTAGFGVATVFGVELSKDQIGAVVVFAGAVMALLRFITTPASEVVVQRPPDSSPVAGPASALRTGTPVSYRLLGEGESEQGGPGVQTTDESGRIDPVLAVLVVILVVLVLIWLGVDIGLDARDR